MRKAIAPVISYVLLIGFAIVLAIIVSVWSKSFVQETTGESIETIEGDLLCREVRINANYNTGCTSINITNNGYIIIEKFAVNRLDPVSSSIEETSLSPYESTIFTQSSSNSVEIIPIVKVKNRLIGCADKKFFISDCNS